MFSSSGLWYFNAVFNNSDERAVVKLLDAGRANPSKVFSSRQSKMLSSALGVPPEGFAGAFDLINLDREKILLLSPSLIEASSKPILKVWSDTLGCVFDVSQPAKSILEATGAVAVSILDLAFLDDSVLRSLLTDCDETWADKKSAVEFLASRKLSQREITARVAECSRVPAQTDADIIPVTAGTIARKTSKAKRAARKTSGSSKRTKSAVDNDVQVALPAEILPFPWCAAPFSAAQDADQASWVELVQPQDLFHGLILVELTSGPGITSVAQVCEGQVWLPSRSAPTFSLPDTACWVLSQYGLDMLGDQLVADDWPAFFQPAPRAKASSGFAIQRPPRVPADIPTTPSGTNSSSSFSPSHSAVSLAESLFERLRTEPPAVDRRQADRLCAIAGFVNITRGVHVQQVESLFSKNMDPKGYNVHPAVLHALGDTLEKLPAFQTLESSLQFLNFQFVSTAHVSAKAGLQLQSFLADTIRTPLQLVQAMSNLEECSDWLHNFPGVTVQRRFIADGWVATKEAIMYDKHKTGLALMPIDFQLSVVDKQLLELSRAVNSNAATSDDWGRGQLHKAAGRALALPANLNQDQIFFLAKQMSHIPKKFHPPKSDAKSAPPPSTPSKVREPAREKRTKQKPAAKEPATPTTLSTATRATGRSVCHRHFLFHLKAFPTACTKGQNCEFSHDFSSLNRAEGLSILESIKNISTATKATATSNLPA